MPQSFFRIVLAAFSLVLALALAAPAEAQDQDLNRRWTVLAGIGADMGWLGVRAEYYLRDRVSVFGGFGYIPEIDRPDFKGFTGALGVRGYTSGQRHRGFAEASVSQLAGTIRCVSLDSCERDRHFGPGILFGYQFVSSGGFSAQIGGGVGYLFDLPDVFSEEEVQPMFSIGLGYTVR